MARDKEAVEVVLPWEVLDQAVEDLQWEAPVQAVDVLQWEALGQEVDVLPWVVLGLETVLRLLEGQQSPN